MSQVFTHRESKENNVSEFRVIFFNFMGIFLIGIFGFQNNSFSTSNYQLDYKHQFGD